MADQEPDFAAPEGATCAEHRDRIALFKCPRCGRNACLSCFHAPVARCVTCMRRDPTEASPPLPFEAGDGTALGRYFRTFGTAFYPWRSAPAFARPGLAPAIAFFTLSALPLIMLSGILPHTRTLWFGGGAVVPVGSPDSTAMALDVARAIAVQVAISGAELLALVLPMASLVQAYAPGRRDAAIRVVLYRFWLGPLAALIGQLSEWSVPTEVLLKLASMDPSQAAPPQLIASSIVQATLRIFQVIALLATTRLAAGISTPLSLVVVLVPLILHTLVFMLSGHAAAALLPPMKLPDALAPLMQGAGLP